MAYIYQIINLVNFKTYIGETNKKNVEERWKEHISDSKKSEYQSIISSAIKKYGLENFAFEIIEECNENIRFEKETYYIDFFDTLTPKGYNIKRSQYGPQDYTQTEEANKKRSDSCKKFWNENPQQKILHSISHSGEKNSMYGDHRNAGENHPRATSIVHIKTGNIFWGAKQIQDIYGINKNNVTSNCKHKLQSAGKINGEKAVWMYYDEYAELYGEPKGIKYY